jgi:aspartate racemase
LKEKVIGILGGMGPEATAELFYRIIKATPAMKDQDHIRVIIDNNPKIPDRTEAIVGSKASPLPQMVKTARNLERAGADFIVMPCNAAHYYYEDLIKSIRIPILNMIELTATAIKEEFPKVRKVGVIATTGTVKTKIYDRAFEKIGVEVIYPSDLQNTVTEAIYDNIKCGRIKEGRRIIANVAKYLTKRGSEIVISGCTEASLVLKNIILPIPIIDPLQILSEVAVATALGSARNKLSRSNGTSGSSFTRE